MDLAKFDISNDGTQLVCQNWDFDNPVAEKTIPSTIKRARFVWCKFESFTLSTVFRNVAIESLHIESSISLKGKDIVLTDESFHNLCELTIIYVPMNNIVFKISHYVPIGFQHLHTINAINIPLEIDIQPSEWIYRIPSLFPALSTINIPQSRYVFPLALLLPSLRTYVGTCKLNPAIVRETIPLEKLLNYYISTDNDRIEVYNAWHSVLLRRMLQENSRAVFNVNGEISDGKIKRRIAPYMIKVAFDPALDPPFFCPICQKNFLNAGKIAYNQEDDVSDNNDFLDNPHSLLPLFEYPEKTCLVRCNEEKHDKHYMHRICFIKMLCRQNAPHWCIYGGGPFTDTPSSTPSSKQCDDSSARCTISSTIEEGK